MGEGSVLNTSLVWISLGVCAVLATFGAMLAARTGALGMLSFFNRASQVSFRRRAYKFAAELDGMVHRFRSKAGWLDNFSGDYIGIFEEAGWSDAIAKLNLLQVAQREISALLDAGVYRDAMCLGEFLCAGERQLEQWKYDAVSEEWDLLFKWQSEVHAIICEIVDRLLENFEQYEEIGINPGVKQPLIPTLQKLKELE